MSKSSLSVSSNIMEVEGGNILMHLKYLAKYLYEAVEIFG